MDLRKPGNCSGKFTESSTSREAAITKVFLKRAPKILKKFFGPRFKEQFCWTNLPREIRLILFVIFHRHPRFWVMAVPVIMRWGIDFKWLTPLIEIGWVKLGKATARQS